MRTNHVSILLPDYLDGTLTRQEAESIEEHLRICPICRVELNEMRKSFAAIEGASVPELPKPYFASILPSVRQRLDRQRHFEWSHNPILNKIVLPLSAAAIIAVLIWRVPPSNLIFEEENQLQAVVDSATTEDIAEIMQENVPSQDLSSLNAAVLSRALANDRFVNRELVQEALTSETTSPFYVFSDVSAQQILGDFDETQTGEILQRLGNMETL